LYSFVFYKIIPRATKKIAPTVIMTAFMSIVPDTGTFGVGRDVGVAVATSAMRCARVGVAV